MIKKKKCFVCNYKFVIEKEKVYTVKKRVLDIDELTTIYYDVMNCPNCGCQNHLAKRLEAIEEITEKQREKL